MSREQAIDEAIRRTAEYFGMNVRQFYARYVMTHSARNNDRPNLDEHRDQWARFLMFYRELAA